MLLLGVCNKRQTPFAYIQNICYDNKQRNYNGEHIDEKNSTYYGWRTWRTFLAKK